MSKGGCLPSTLQRMDREAREQGWVPPIDALAHGQRGTGAREADSHPHSGAWAERHVSNGGCLPSTLQRMGREAREQGWVPPIHAIAHRQRGT